MKPTPVWIHLPGLPSELLDARLPQIVASIGTPSRWTPSTPLIDQCNQSQPLEQPATPCEDGVDGYSSVPEIGGSSEHGLLYG
ncbi:hypothetical protein MUK42_37661 [Musa troglodytarum]|uniref:Uncharacterized protein n=1 Tax=Musa troglodytarum TaxID=320322 RepID=A0A9E7GKJ2_9LILI|nr:hypothetical protein MUK42_37661 [Musa troglodytarum]